MSATARPGGREEGTTARTARVRAGEGARDEVPEAVGLQADPDPGGAGVPGVPCVLGDGTHVGHGHPVGQSAAQLDIDGAAPRRDEGGVDDVGDGAGVVGRRVREGLLVLVGGSEEVHEAVHGVGESGIGPAESPLDIGGAQGPVGDIQADHGQRPALVEDDVGGLGVAQDVELGHRRRVADAVGAAHEDDLLEAFDDAGLHASGHRDIGQGAGGDDGDGAGLVAHHGLDEPGDGVLLGQRAARLGQLDAVQAGLAVDVGGVNGLADERLHAAGVDGDLGASGELAHRPGVEGDLLEAVVAADGRDAQEVDLRAPEREEDRDRVIMARIAIEDHLGCHTRLLCNCDGGCASLRWAPRRDVVTAPRTEGPSVHRWPANGRAAP